MKTVLILLLLHGAYGDYIPFGSSLQGPNPMCQPWVCLNNKLGLNDTLPPKDVYARVLKSILPAGPWHSFVTPALDACYAVEKPRQRYADFCAGQGLMHCVIDRLIDYCPEASLRKNDGCTPVYSVAGFKYMFSQSRYQNMELNLASERRPIWFLKNYFSSKCCDLPEMFTPSVLAECNFTSFMHYFEQPPKPKVILPVAEIRAKYPYIFETVSSTKTPDTVAEFKDPLDCCDMSEFMSPAARSECGFDLTWEGQSRLQIREELKPDDSSTSTTAKPAVKAKHHDVRVVPQSCDKSTCVFSKLNIITASGVDRDAFSRLLDNFTTQHPEWQSAKARVLTTCLARSMRTYEAGCEINKLLACTFDVLSENCPHAKKASLDPCKHTHTLKNDTICQINSDKFRPKNRRKFCDFPRFVHHDVLAQCGVTAINRIEPVPAPPATKKPVWLTRGSVCKDLTSSTKCILSKMGVLTKYNFLDYFMMKDRLRKFTSEPSGWNFNVLLSTFNSVPMYREHCASPKKLLNVLDTILMTCPVTRRKNTEQCNKLFGQIPTNVAAMQKQNATSTQVLTALSHLDHLSAPNYHLGNLGQPFARFPTRKRQMIFDMALSKSSKVAPHLKVLNIKPYKTIIKENKRPLILAPVYQRYPPIINSSLNGHYIPHTFWRNAPSYQSLHPNSMWRSELPKPNAEIQHD